MEKNKILHLISNPGLGGAQSLIEGLVKNNSNHFVYSFYYKKESIFNRLSGRYFYYDINCSKVFSLNILFQLINLIRKNDFKILHLHLLKPLIYSSIIKIFIPKIKIIYHEHGPIQNEKINKKYSLIIKILNLFVDEYILISEATKELFLKKTKISKNKIKLIYNYVDINKYDKNKVTWDIKKERKKLGLNKKDFVVGFAGRLIERKGWKEYLNVAKELKSKNIKFLIAGNGDDKDEMLEFIKTNDLNNVIYLGYVDNMPWFYSLLGCFIIPSHWEPMGLVPIEAQLMKIPVISSDTPALNEIIKDNETGLLFEVKDNNDLSEKIITLYSNQRLRNRLIENALKNAKEFNLDQYMKKINKLYGIKND
jgi:L-malate glycosyltransferase